MAQITIDYGEIPTPTPVEVTKCASGTANFATQNAWAKVELDFEPTHIIVWGKARTTIIFACSYDDGVVKSANSNYTAYWFDNTSLADIKVEGNSFSVKQGDTSDYVGEVFHYIAYRTD